ncbi:MAG TPA: BamA/TamA family outer membrane protein [Chryseosolibacter sp.]|nr:BamA/TamA family outer membrane protein [Chryseosolibacter sp.]
MKQAILIVLLLSWLNINAQDSGEVSHTLFLIGDCGEHYIDGDPIGSVIKSEIEKAGVNATLVYLGDNIYPKGMPEKGHRLREQSERIMQYQVDWLPATGAKGIFVPGNHDWHHWGRHGQDYLMNQQLWIDSLKNPDITLLPRDGCPGPVEVPIDSNTLLVVLDTQWPLHQWNKPGEHSSCDAKTTEDLLTQLNDVFFRNQDKRVIIAGHHPLITYGEHGGVFTWKSHLFPLTDLSHGLYIPMPGLGSIYPLWRKWFGHNQDTKHPVYRQLSEGIQKIMALYPGSVYVAGHEHALQHIVKDSTHFIVSGSGAKTEYVRKKGYAIYADDVRGFVRVRVMQSGEVVADFIKVDESSNNGEVVYSTTIPFSSEIEISPRATSSFGDTVVVSHASTQYEVSDFHKSLFGENYREEWKQNISVPVFDIGTVKGGLKIVQRGGGQQTVSLRLEDSTGRQYVLRSVEKFPENAVPEVLRETFVQDLVQDQISAAHPYAALVIPPLAEAAGIYHTNPKLYYAPSDPRFGEYQQLMANSLTLFEERPAGDWSDADFFGNSEKIVNTTKVLEKLAEDNDNKVDQASVLRARLFDLLIGDWDRHDDQWRWASFKEKKATTYKPIPRDRDQAFFVNEGRLAKLWSRKWALPKFEGFDEAIDWPSGLSYNARYFDRSFLTGLSKEQWLAASKQIQSSVTDAVIELAIRTWPDSIYQHHGKEIIGALKKRRDHLTEDALEHYAFLAQEVDVVGSDKNERFQVERLDGGDVKVTVFKISKSGDVGKVIYERTFLREETDEIRLYGLNGSDEFFFSGDNRRSIKVRVIGGDGEDQVKDESIHRTLARKTLYYDLRDQGTEISSPNIADRMEDTGEVNAYDRNSFQYNRLAPLVYGNYNFDDGMFIGGGFISINHGFRKDPFKSRHIFLATIAPQTLSFDFQYQGKFSEVLGKWDVGVDVDVKSPNYVNNFFGWGNESKFDRDVDELPGSDFENAIQYYRYRFEEMRIEPVISRRFSNWGSLSFGPVFQRIEMEEPDAGSPRFIKDYASALPANLFDEYRSFGGLGWGIDIDKRDDQRITTRGVTLSLKGRNMRGISKESTDFNSYESSLAFYHSFKLPSRLVFALRFGGGINTGKYEFYQAQVLDGKTQLRGYRKTRFYGDSKIFNNVELRLKIASIRTYLFPASLGLLAFHDTGRVWYKDALGNDSSTVSGTSSKWHSGYGGGIWFTPFNLTVLSAELAHGDDGYMFYARLGFLF